MMKKIKCSYQIDLSKELAQSAKLLTNTEISCENCGATYNPTDLIDPKSVTSNTKPILKTSEHYFFKLPELQDT